MNANFLSTQASLPRALPVGNHVPVRREFSWAEWDISNVKSHLDLPPYFLLGHLDDKSFNSGISGWRARWTGKEERTYVEMVFKAWEGRWECRKVWNGLDSGFDVGSKDLSVMKALQYSELPSSWERYAKDYLESTIHQLTYIEQRRDQPVLLGFPDGFAKNILIPIPAGDVANLIVELKDALSRSKMTFPVAAEIRLFNQNVFYADKPNHSNSEFDGTFDESVVACISDTGLLPLAHPRRFSNDGMTGWMLNRQVYCLVVMVPFVGVADTLEMLNKHASYLLRRKNAALSTWMRSLVVPPIIGNEEVSLVSPGEFKSMIMINGAADSIVFDSFINSDRYLAGKDISSEACRISEFASSVENVLKSLRN